MKILADRNMAGVDALFAGLGEVDYFDGRQLAQVGDADLLLVRSVTRVDANLLGNNRPRFVGTATSGFDHVDRALLSQLDIPFAHAPGSNADSVVDYVLSALWRCERLEAALAGAPVGIVGYGHIGRRLHERLARLGITCRAYDPWLAPETFPLLADLDAVLDCPVLCLHAALTHADPWPSYHMLDAARLGRLPEGALLLSAGRGELVAGGELLDLAARRPDIDLVLDVWEGEPGFDPALLSACRYGTAHIAGYSHDGKLRATEMLRDAACAALAIDPGPSDAAAAAINVDVPAPDGAALASAPLDSPALEGAALIGWLLEQVYDIAEDDQLLRSAGPGGFDGLRKGYRRRRELGRLRIRNAQSLGEEARALCIALGCELQEREAPC